MFEVFTNVVLVNPLVLCFRLKTILKGAFDNGMANFYFLLHVFGDGVPERGEFHIDLNDVLMRKCEYLMVEKIFGGDLCVEECVEVGVDDDFLLPVFHRLLVFINAHLILIKQAQLHTNLSTTYLIPSLSNKPEGSLPLHKKKSISLVVIFILKPFGFELLVALQYVQRSRGQLARVPVCHLQDRTLVFVQLLTAPLQVATRLSNQPSQFFEVVSSLTH